MKHDPLTSLRRANPVPVIPVIDGGGLFDRRLLPGRMHQLQDCLDSRR